MAWPMINRMCRECIRVARTVRGNVRLMKWARRGLPTIVIVASAFFASPARAANAYFSCTEIDNGTCDGSAPSPCDASATLQWSKQPGSLSFVEIYVCDDTEGSPCAIVWNSSQSGGLSTPSNRTGSISGTNSHSLQPTSPGSRPTRSILPDAFSSTAPLQSSGSSRSTSQPTAKTRSQRSDCLKDSASCLMGSRFLICCRPGGASLPRRIIATVRRWMD